jgi:hypothetical protein
MGKGVVYNKPLYLILGGRRLASGRPIRNEKAMYAANPACLALALDGDGIRRHTTEACHVIPCGGARGSSSRYRGIQAGIHPAPIFALHDQTGAGVSTRSLRGQVVAITF